MPSITGYDHLSLTVRDTARSTSWYTDVLGFTKVREVNGADFERVILLHAQAGVALGLTRHGPHGSHDPFSEFRAGMDHVAFGVSSRSDLEAWKARLAELGVEHSEVKESPTGWVITLRDPDNIQLELRAEATTTS